MLFNSAKNYPFLGTVEHFSVSALLTATIASQFNQDSVARA